MYTEGRIIRARKRAGLKTYRCFLDVHKAYDTEWRNELWKQLSTFGINGKTWGTLIKVTILDGKVPALFSISRGVPRLCTLSPTLLQMYINNILKVVEAAGQRVQVGGREVSGLLSADNFVMCGTPEELQEKIEATMELLAS